MQHSIRSALGTVQQTDSTVRTRKRQHRYQEDGKKKKTSATGGDRAGSGEGDYTL